MNTVLWIAAAVLALAFLAAGAMKLTRPKPALVAAGQGWAADVPDAAVKAIGAVEVLGALGLVLPALLDTATVLVPLAATGLAVVMLGAVVVHARRGETTNVIVNVVLLVVAAFVAWQRFGAHSF